jgi:hypothetical protein
VRPNSLTTTTTVLPVRPHLLREAGQAASQLVEPVGEVAGGVALADVGVPAADVDKADVVALLHHLGDAARFQLEALGGDGVAAGGIHFAGQVFHHILAHGEAFAHRLRQRRALVHGGDHFRLARVDARLADVAQRGVGHLQAALHDQRQLVGEGDRAGAVGVERGGQAVEEAGAVVARRSSGWPSSMLSCVSKWLRDRSSVPANGTKATCPAVNSG